jgi:hypothetical protein
VQKYVPTIQEKYKPLPLSIEALFEKDVAKLVSNKLPGRFFLTKISCDFLFKSKAIQRTKLPMSTNIF